jgi:hypothetical protein
MDERDVPKVDWYKLFLDFVQVSVDPAFVLQLCFECRHSPLCNESISIRFQSQSEQSTTGSLLSQWLTSIVWVFGELI